MPNLTLKKAFNANGDDSQTARKLFGGNPTGIVNLNSVVYKWATDLYKIMFNNHWVPEKVSLVDDRVSLKELTPDELYALKRTLSFLIALDSMQNSTLPRISSYITAPEVSAIYTLQEFQELVHSQSYQYILQELFSSVEREEIYNMWRDDPILLKRNQAIASIYQEFMDSPTERNFKRILAADFALEGIYFYDGFNYFYQLKSRSKIPLTAQIIKYIENDEQTHVSFFAYQIREVFDFSNPDDVEILTSTLKNAVQEEIDWSHEVYGDRILGISYQSSEEYPKFLGNKLAKVLKLPILYPGFNKNPYEIPDKRENFFETTVTEYSQSAAVDGWDDF